VKPAEPMLGVALAEDLAAKRTDRPTADNTLLRGSDAYACARRIAFGALRVPKDVPYSPDTLMAFDAGQHHHTRLQGLLASKFGAELEVECSYREAGVDLSGHADATYQWGQKKHCVEIKSMKSYPFIRAAGGRDNFGHIVPAEGPKPEHVVQCGIYADSPQIQADICHMVYINKEDGRVAEWLIPLKGEPFGPDGKDVHQLVVEELARLKGIEADIRAQMLPWRRIPGHGLVKTPPAADSKDEPWNCRYCPWQPTCAKLPPSKVSLSVALDGADEGEAF
jgi:hypothetical protein